MIKAHRSLQPNDLIRLTTQDGQTYEGVIANSQKHSTGWVIQFVSRDTGAFITWDEAKNHATLELLSK